MTTGGFGNRTTANNVVKHVVGRKWNDEAESAETASKTASGASQSDLVVFEL